MEIKVGYQGRFRRLPTTVNCDWKKIDGGIVFKPENINEELLLEKFIDILKRYSPEKVDDFLTTIY